MSCVQNIREALAAEAAAPPQAAIADASFDGRAVPGGTQPGAAQRRPQRPPAAVAPDDGMSPGSVAAIVASVLIVVLVCMVASFVIIHRGRFSKRTQPMRGSQSRGQKVRAGHPRPDSTSRHRACAWSRGRMHTLWAQCAAQVAAHLLRRPLTARRRPAGRRRGPAGRRRAALRQCCDRGAALY